MPLSSKSKELRAKAFNEYMLDTLQASRDFSKRLEQRNQQTLYFFLVMATALMGGGVTVASTVVDEVLKLTILTLDLVLIGGFGTLTYVWILTSVVQGMQEGYKQIFLNKYFRDMDPEAFEQYGLATFLTWYRRAYGKTHHPSVHTGVSVTLLLIALLSTIMFAIAGYTGWNALRSARYRPLDVLIGLALFGAIGVVCLATMTAVWLISRRSIGGLCSEGHDLVAKYHTELNDSQNTQSTSAT